MDMIKESALTIVRNAKCYSIEGKKQRTDATSDMLIINELAIFLNECFYL